MKFATLCYLIDAKADTILLGKKKYGGAKGKLNGFGGKVEESDTTFTNAVKREFREETSIKLIKPVLSAIINFHFGEVKESSTVFVYRCNDWIGIPKESNEMSVRWYKLKNVDIKKMWLSDSIWFPVVMNYPNLVIDLQFSPPESVPQNISINFNQNLYENKYSKPI